MKFKPYVAAVILASLVTVVTSCSGLFNDDDNDSEKNDDHKALTYNFDNGDEGWTAGFADYPSEWDYYTEEGLDFRHESLPAYLGGAGSLFITGNNSADDLFMFIKKPVTGLHPDTYYAVTFKVDIASQYPEMSFGIGGSPGASVKVKAGAAAVEPVAEVTDRAYRLNIVKDPNIPGSPLDMYIIGNIGIEEFDSEKPYKIKQLESTAPMIAKTNGEGVLWAIIGTDSGFEGRTSIYYSTVTVSLTMIQ